MLTYILFVVANHFFCNQKAFIAAYLLFLVEIDQLKSFIVKKLFHHGYIGGRHTAIENLQKGLPGHFRGDVSDAVKELIKEEILIPKPTSYGLHVALNSHKRDVIQKYLA